MGNHIDYAASFLPVLGAMQLLVEAAERTAASIESFCRNVREWEYLWVIKRSEAEQRQYYSLLAEGVPILDAMSIIEKGTLRPQTTSHE